MTSAFKLTARQEEAQAILAGPATHLMLFGGSRSGKTFLLTRNTVMRAVKAPNSRHAIFRFRLNHIKASIVLDTFPKVMQIAFPGVEYDLHKQELYCDFPNGSQLWFGGVDDKDRTEKILGMEFATVYFNECSQIPVGSVDTVLTRLAQKAEARMVNRQPLPLKLRAYYDCNPPSKAHWTYRRFVQRIDPDTKRPLPNPDDYASFQINPTDNAQNLSPEYIRQLEAMPARLRARFLEGRFADATPNALFPEEHIDRWRVLDAAVPQLVRVVVAVDPSGADDEASSDNDAIGIVVVGIGVDGAAYVLEDCTVKAGPATWGRVVASAFDRHQADCVVAETNFGGAMVQQVIQTARPRTPFRGVTASRGKAVRAEPFSALYEQGKVRHVGLFAELEDELAAFSTAGYTASGSPNRADALIWALAALFPAITAPAKRPELAGLALPAAHRW
jgi:predicted phage terminase large subunit-like protein